MTSLAISVNVGDHQRVRTWIPDRLRASQTKELDDILRERIEEALDALMRDRLEIDGEFSARTTNGEAIGVVSAVDGLKSSLTCRMGRAECDWLIENLYGTGRSQIDDQSTDVHGPIVQQTLNGLLLLFVDRFCEVASSVGGYPLSRTTRSATPTKADDASETAGTDRISVAPRGLRVEYELSEQDLRYILSNDRSPTLEKSDPNAETVSEFKGRIDTTLVRLDAMLDERELTLGEIRRWRVGDLLPLNSTPASIVDLVIEGKPLFRCGLARSEGYFALRVIDQSSFAAKGQS